MNNPPQHVVTLVTALSECTESNQMFDVGNDRLIRESLLNIPVTITSARPRPSDYHDGKSFAQIGIILPDGTDAQFNIGGNAASLPLILQRLGRLPVVMILRQVETRSGKIAWKWNRHNA